MFNSVEEKTAIKFVFHVVSNFPIIIGAIAGSNIPNKR